MKSLTELMEEFYISFNSKNAALFQSATENSKSSRESKWIELMRERSLPEIGWKDESIEGFLQELAAMDANNFEGVIGMGEREGRINSYLVKRRHFGFAHGMGRSGNLKDPQPKAVGSTILVQLTHKLVISALRCWGFNKAILAGGLNIMPVCTGMSMMLTLMAVASEYKKVIWLRIDQKSCIKAILGANLEIIVVEGKLVGDEIVTDLERIEEVIRKEDGKIHSIVSCVSCFTPRAPDSIVQISQLARKYSIAHIVNAAYGGTSNRACNLLNSAVANGQDGRIDAVVMSLDKNFMVPVSGAIIFGPQFEFIDRIAKRYAGRASTSHIIDLFITLIELGRKGLQELKSSRLSCFEHYKNKLKQVDGIKVMETGHNDISLAIRLPAKSDSSIGSQLFKRNISGARVIEIENGKLTVLDGIEFQNFGSHLSAWKEEFCYLNVAAAVGCEAEDIDLFIKKLIKLL